MSKKKLLRQFAISTNREMEMWDLIESDSEKSALTDFCSGGGISEEDDIYVVEIMISNPTHYRMEKGKPSFNKISK
jgi:hypothetical protein